MARFGHHERSVSIRQGASERIILTDQNNVIESYNTDTYIRQKLGAELSFVTIDNNSIKPNVVIVPTIHDSIGTYNLTIETL